VSTHEHASVGAADEVRLLPAQRALALARIALGFVFLWAFLDKTFGLGRSTPSDKAWKFGSGTSPAAGYLSAVDGPFAWLFNPMAGHWWVDWPYMLGMLGVGIGLMTGLAFRFSAVVCCLFLAMFWMASLPLSTNPIIDDHVIELLMLVGLVFLRNGRIWGAQGWWDDVVGRRIPFLK